MLHQMWLQWPRGCNSSPDCPNIVTMSLLSSWSTSMLDFWILVCISFSCLSKSAHFSLCIWSVNLILLGAVCEIGEFMCAGWVSSSLHFELLLLDGKTWSSYHTADVFPPTKLSNFGSSKILHEGKSGLDPQTVDLLKVLGWHVATHRDIFLLN